MTFKSFQVRFLEEIEDTKMTFRNYLTFIQHVVYVIKQSVSPKIFNNERLFTIQAFTINIVHCTLKSTLLHILILSSKIFSVEFEFSTTYVCK